MRRLNPREVDVTKDARRLQDEVPEVAAGGGKVQQARHGEIGQRVPENERVV